MDINTLGQRFIESLEHYTLQFVAILPKIAIAFFVLLTALIAIRWFSTYAGRWLKRRMKDAMLAEFLTRAIKGALIIVAVILAMRIAGLNDAAGSLLAGAGIGAFVIGFAFKDIGENFLAGVLLAFKRPFKTGDIVELGGQKGRVVTLNLRDTQLHASDGRDIYVPNASVVKSPVINYTPDARSMEQFTLKVPNTVDFAEFQERVEEAITQLDGALGKRYSPKVRITSLHDKAVEFNVVYWHDPEATRFSERSLRAQAVQETLNVLEAMSANNPTN